MTIAGEFFKFYFFHWLANSFRHFHSEIRKRFPTPASKKSLGDI